MLDAIWQCELVLNVPAVVCARRHNVLWVREEIDADKLTRIKWSRAPMFICSNRTRPHINLNHIPLSDRDLRVVVSCTGDL
jgi:hypothetical protein